MFSLHQIERQNFQLTKILLLFYCCLCRRKSLNKNRCADHKSPDTKFYICLVKTAITLLHKLWMKWKESSPVRQSWVNKWSLLLVVELRPDQGFEDDHADDKILLFGWSANEVQRIMEPMTSLFGFDPYSHSNTIYRKEKETSSQSSEMR